MARKKNFYSDRAIDVRDSNPQKGIMYALLEVAESIERQTEVIDFDNRLKRGHFAIGKK